MKSSHDNACDVMNMITFKTFLNRSGITFCLVPKGTKGTFLEKGASVEFAKYKMSLVRIINVK